MNQPSRYQIENARDFVLRMAPVFRKYLQNLVDYRAKLSGYLGEFERLQATAEDELRSFTQEFAIRGLLSGFVHVRRVIDGALPAAKAKIDVLPADDPAHAELVALVDRLESEYAVTRAVVESISLPPRDESKKRNP